MTITTTPGTADQRLRVQARPAGFRRDVVAVAGRALRAAIREPAAFIPALMLPLFFFAVNVGALQDVSGFAGITDYKAFQLPVAIVFAVTGISSAPRMVTDITSGYFDRLLISPIRRCRAGGGCQAALYGPRQHDGNQAWFSGSISAAVLRSNRRAVHVARRVVASAG